MTSMANQVAIIAGAASGPGAAEAHHFASLGCKVVHTDINSPGQQAANAIGPASIYVEHEVGDEESWQIVVARATERFGGIDILTNEAGT